MTENDAMRLLAAANPVRVEDLTPLDVPGLRPRRSQRRFVLAIAAAVLASGSATLIAAFVSSGGGDRTSTSHPTSTTHRPSGGLFPYTPELTMERPLQGLAAQPITLTDAPDTLGGPVVLPENSFVRPSDAGAVWGATAEAGQAGVGVAFPAQRLIIQYERPPIPDPLAIFQGMAKEDPGSELIYLNGGVPAIAMAQTSDPSSWGSIQFVAGGTTITVLGHDDQATLQSVAQSILDRSGSQ